MKTAFVAGSAGFIGGHLVRKLQSQGYYVVGADIQAQKYSQADKFYQFDLRDIQNVRFVFGKNKIQEVYQLAADMGGAGYIFTGEHDADVMSNSAKINLNIAECISKKWQMQKIFYSSSACMYPQEIQHEINSPALSEDMAYPGNPDSEYGWEKLFSERLYLSYARNYGLDVRIGRFHNIFGIEGSWNNGKEKFPAAICRKVAEAKNEESIILWGDGLQTRSFLNVDECLKTVELLIQSDITEPLNIGSDEMISCNDLAKMVIEISGKKLIIEHDLTKPQGVRGRNSDNTKIKQLLGYAPQQNLKAEMTKLYNWINKQING